MKRLMIGGVVVVAITASLVSSGALASVKAKGTAKVAAATVTVTAGKPVPYAFLLSTQAIRPGPVVFKVTNKGSLLYSFEICSGPGDANVCFGDSTPAIDPGKTVTLSVKLPKGSYEYIGTADFYVTTKGNLTVTPTAKATPTTTIPGASTGTTKPNGAGSPGVSPGTTGAGGTSTTPAQTAPTVGNNVGDPVLGASLFQQAGCGSCHTLKAAGSTGTVGPNLDQVMPDENTVITNVTFGNAMGMPAFSPQFSTAQIQDIAAYVYNSTHPG